MFGGQQNNPIGSYFIFEFQILVSFFLSLSTHVCKSKEFLLFSVMLFLFSRFTGTFLGSGTPVCCGYFLFLLLSIQRIIL